MKAPKPPQFAKGIRRTVEVAGVAWIDLLGYGSQIAAAGFNPTDPAASQAIDRVHKFHEIAARHSHRSFPTFVMNDGAAAYRDLSPRTGAVTCDFICRSWRLYRDILDVEQKAGFPGPRMVIAAGFRTRRESMYSEIDTHAEVIWARYRAGVISADKAIAEAIHARPYFDAVPALQANFAFTRAYMAESSGTAGGLPGPAAYLDSALVPSLVPRWLELGPAIPWHSDKPLMEAAFHRIEAADAHGTDPETASDEMDAV